jgi:hypothetical protein
VDDNNATPADLEALAVSDERHWQDECSAVLAYPEKS